MIRRLLCHGSCLALTCCILYGLAVAGASSDVKLFVDLFESRYRAARTLQATFLERYLENGQVVRVESGTAYFRRPGKMRWEYQAPEKNIFLVDGKNAWFYVPADHTATRVPAKSSADWRTPLALLAGEMKVSRVCAQVQAAPAEKMDGPDNVVLRCELRGAAPQSEPAHNSDSTSASHESVQSVYLEIVKKTGELVGVTVRDPGGVGIEFRFANWQANPPVADSLFHFLAPPGVAIVNGELPAGNGGVNP